jgi:hypothetical protein
VIRSGGVATAIAVALLLTGCMTHRPRIVLQDDTANWAALAGCDRDASTPGCSDVLSDRERQAFEDFLSHFVNRVPQRTFESIRFRVLGPDALGAMVRQVGGTVEIPASYMKRAFPREEERGIVDVELSIDSMLGFGLAHELAHMLSPWCSGECQESLRCELEADEVAKQIAGPSLLAQVARQEKISIFEPLETRLSRAEEARDAPGRWADDTAECLRVAEIHLRYSIAEEEYAWSYLFAEWDDRNITRRTLERARDASTEGRRLLAVCQNASRFLRPDGRGNCMVARLAALDSHYRARGEVVVPKEGHPALAPDYARRTGDARILVLPEIGPAWGLYSGHAVESGWTGRARVVWEGGMEGGGPGVRVGWAHLVDAPMPKSPFAGSDTTVGSIEAIGRFIGTAAPVATIVDAGLGLYVITRRGHSPATRPGLTFDGRLGWPLARRLHIDVGAGMSVIPMRYDRVEGTVLGSLMVGLELHYGTYGPKRGDGT